MLTEYETFLTGLKRESIGISPNGGSSGVGLIIGSVGALGFLLIGINETNLPFGSIGYINFPALLIISILSVLTAPYGVRWAHSLDESKLKKFFGFYLLLVSAGMFFKANLTVAEI